MANNCNCTLKVFGSAAALDAFKKRARGKYPKWYDSKQKESALCFNSLVPLPKTFDVQDGNNCDEPAAKKWEGIRMWTSTNWGCPGGNDDFLHKDSPAELVYIFTTPNRPPVNFVEQVAITNPELQFSLYYSDLIYSGYTGESHIHGKNLFHCLNNESADLSDDDYPAQSVCRNYLSSSRLNLDLKKELGIWDAPANWTMDFQLGELSLVIARHCILSRMSQPDPASASAALIHAIRRVAPLFVETGARWRTAKQINRVISILEYANNPNLKEIERALVALGCPDRIRDDKFLEYDLTFALPRLESPMGPTAEVTL